MLRKGFTLIEIILVIIILSIVSSIGTEIIAHLYESYIIQRAQYRASIKTELAAIQIANRLEYAISGTVVRKSSLFSNAEDINEVATQNHTILQWVGADIDSFNAITSTKNRLPGWSGFCDIDVSTISSISTPGSHLSLVNMIKKNLGLTSKPQIYFQAKSGLMSYTATLHPATQSIDLSSYIPSTISTPARIVEHYKLATSSYALETRNNGDLILYYNFTPQRAVAIVNAKSQMLLQHVSTFTFRGDGDTIRFKLCIDEPIGDNNITICKEKAVF